eukprot:TRINITY_DN12591_c0_g1_i1.p1 TRINITY_DN12591_c0_g1~~TRINITY_DN12591_c0_g1_i1.p1  ORF type:complete len:718 (-),score=151.13 TRINITY_DN12591_c0_g1_i1:722-2875(-)
MKKMENSTEGTSRNPDSRQFFSEKRTRDPGDDSLASDGDLNLVPLCEKIDRIEREDVVLEILFVQRNHVLFLYFLVKSDLRLPHMREKKEFPFESFMIEDVANLARKLYLSLFERINHWEECYQDHLGDIFHLYLPYLGDIYPKFSERFTQSKGEIKKKNSLESGLKKSPEDKKDRFMSPVKHICTLVGLLQRLLQTTPSRHGDYTILTQVIGELENLRETVTASEQVAKSEEKMKRLAARSGGFERLATEPPPSDGVKRMWMKDGEIFAIGIAERNILEGATNKFQKKKNLELILFNDMLVVSCLVGKKTPTQVFSQPLGIMWLKENVVGEKISSDLDDDFEHVLNIIGPEMQWVLAFSSAEKKNDWMQALLRVLHKESITSSAEGEREGSYEFSNGLGKYKGEWLDGFFHGKGEFVTSTAIYDGHWDFNLRVGWGIYRPTEYKMKPKVCGWYWKTLEDINTKDEYGMWTSGTLTKSEWDLIMTGATLRSEPSGTLLIEAGKPNSRLIRTKTGKLRIERDQAHDAKKTVFISEGEIVGDTAMIPDSVASANVFTHTQCTFEEVSVDVLYSILEANPGICMRFYRNIAKKLAGFLKELHAPQKSSEEENTEDTSEMDSKKPVAVPKCVNGTSPSKHNPVETKVVSFNSIGTSNALQVRFGLPPQEVFLKAHDCMCVSGIKRGGKFYLFRNHFVFEAQVFGMKQIDDGGPWTISLQSI